MRILANGRPLPETERASFDALLQERGILGRYTAIPEESPARPYPIQLIRVMNNQTGGTRPYFRGYHTANPRHWLRRFAQDLEAREI